MRRWTFIGLVVATVALAGWAATELRADEEDEHAERMREVEARAGDETPVAPGAEHQPEPAKSITKPAAPADTRDARQRVDDVIAELRGKHDELVAAGATEAAKTVQAQIDRLEAEQRARAAMEE